MEGVMIKVNPEELLRASSEFGSKASTVGNLTTEMMNTVTGLSSIWEGEGATTYIGKFRELEDDIQKMIRMIQEHSEDLQQIGSAYIAEESEVSELAASLSGDVIV